MQINNRSVRMTRAHESMKKIIRMALVMSTGGCWLQAASFDCAKAETSIGHQICADSVLSCRAENMWFNVNPVYVIANDVREVLAVIAALPDANGYEKLRDVHQTKLRHTSNTLSTLASRTSMLIHIDSVRRVDGDFVVNVRDYLCSV